LASYLAGHVDEALPLCEEALRLDPDHFWAQYLKALCHVRLRRWGEAEVGIKVCLGKRPGDPWLLLLLGSAHTGMKRYEAAEDDFQAALASETDSAFRAAVLTSRSAMRTLDKRPAAAEDDLHEAIRLQSEAYHGYLNLAVAFSQRRDWAG